MKTQSLKVPYNKKYSESNGNCAISLTSKEKVLVLWYLQLAIDSKLRWEVELHLTK